MSTKRDFHKCNRPAAATPASVREPLPMDLLLEIVARCDVTTIVRCARVSKFLRDAILDPAFRGRLALQAVAGGGGFDSTLLFGVSYLTHGPQRVLIHTPSKIQLHARLQACSLVDSFMPVASRDRLLLLCWCIFSPEGDHGELCICDTTTGHITSVPNVAVSMSYVHAFLSVSDAAGGSYEIFVMERYFRFQTFSSKHGQWDAAQQESVTYLRRYICASTSRPRVVIGRTIYGLCDMNTCGPCSNGILAVDVDAAEARTMELPPDFSSRMMSCKREKHLLLASVRGRLSLLVAETGGISMWTLTPASMLQPAATWSRQLVVGAEEIVQTVGFFIASSPFSYVLEDFEERSGAVIVRVDRSDLLRIDLGTKVMTKLHHLGDVSVACLFLHETNLASLLKKSF